MTAESQANVINPGPSGPADWPESGPIDLTIHDAPHASSTTEWWYSNMHLTLASGAPVSLFVAFFRKVEGTDPVTGETVYVHSVTWAISELNTGAYYATSLVDPRMPEIAVEHLNNGSGPKDPFMNRAVREVFESGNVPLPDRVFDGEVYVSLRRLDLDFAGNRLFRNDDGSYSLHLYDKASHCGCKIDFTPQKEPVRHGDNGVVRGAGGEDMFYYFIPRCKAEGSVFIRGTSHKIAEGSAWYDHEFGRPPEVDEEASNDAPPRPVQAVPAAGDIGHNVAWSWASAQLNDGSEISVYCLTNEDDGHNMGQWAIVIDAQGKRSSYPDFEFIPGKEWTSIRTFRHYPLEWTIRVPGAGLELKLEAAMPDQEFITSISSPAFWEGRMKVRGTKHGKPIEGNGYVERSGFDEVESLDDFFGAVSKEVRHSVEDLLPLEPSFEQARDLIASEEREHYMQGVNTKTLGESLIAPIRDITDRGGKAWRSYAALACCDVVQGDSRQFSRWLAMPEFLHVGSLIVDDVQDRSTVRRGGPTAHLIHGEAQAINSGTAAYFLTQHLLHSDRLSSSQRLELYDLYFEAMRAGHAGQALDLRGQDHLLDEVVKSGNTEELDAAVLACHRLKTAAPAAALARMGAVAGEGSKAQVEAVGNYFEAIGTAFQIIDDVLNIRGFKGDLKSRGEDLKNGTLTYPVAKALGQVDAAKRKLIVDFIRKDERSDQEVQAMVDLIEECGALDKCSAQASELVEEAWAKANPLLVDSMAKVMLRAFSWYILERHY